ncbi:hypothetical protein F442_06745 [Phytophthora nicotianae P10297]|uniref:SANT domain-containing protein n=10 Tax=Phytophthora nicotianae TaxID=4792 RepID=W2RCY6_PHYN3|nr:hypothetical protein PPTG_02798 [Phytophthora nicotianae INRA-310]ETI49364.1 hypothetical protein F443_06709 [Phytophthora nicotianae P1569]ETL42693.1 hypothetical protein L916_06520 [Phytophthora nicotianae]ETO78097.1 hypothetical protein F444_06776 [Phytophthora nicotianae P1976]ETP47065.1 hypothetical protein F442_06745 [Phytophthora nicotianae P10297]ETL95843.1 hypothetical protein L917_06390 [Phytophthora nicotianae]
MQHFLTDKMARRSRAGSVDVESRSESDERSPLTPNKAALLRVQRRTSPLRLDNASGDDAGSADDREGQEVVPAASIWRGDEASDAANADVKLSNMRRYFRAARALYEMQFQMKRPAAILKMKPNSYGLKSRSTFDALAALVSPLRGHQVLDDWTGLEIGLFEEAYERFGKDFYAIAEQLPRKTVKDTIAFYYIWKKHGSCAKTRDDGNLSDDFLPEPEPNVSSETLKLMDRLRKRQIYIQDYLDAARAMYAPQPAYASHHKRQKISEFGLQRVPSFQQGLKGLSPLRVPAVLDMWTPFEIRVFEVAIECYGKDFTRIAEVIGSKSSGDVIAFYYVWKNDSHYQVVKNRWERKDEGRTPKKTLADSKANCS